MGIVANELFVTVNRSTRLFRQGAYGTISLIEHFLNFDPTTWWFTFLLGILLHRLSHRLRQMMRMSNHYRPNHLYVQELSVNVLHGFSFGEGLSEQTERWRCLPHHPDEYIDPGGALMSLVLTVGCSDQFRGSNVLRCAKSGSRFANLVKLAPRWGDG